MLVLGMYASPRKAGNTDVLLDHALEAAAKAGAEVEKLFCRRLKVSGCLECGGCDDTGQCVVDDDMEKVYPLWRRAGAIIISAPIFFYNLPAQAKALIDRSQASWAERILKKGHAKGKRVYDGGKGYLIAVGATRGANLFEGTELTAKYFYDALDMSYEGGLLLRGIEKKGAVDQQTELLAQAAAIGAKAAQG